VYVSHKNVIIKRNLNVRCFEFVSILSIQSSNRIEINNIEKYFIFYGVCVWLLISFLQQNCVGNMVIWVNFSDKKKEWGMCFSNEKKNNIC